MSNSIAESLTPGGREPRLSAVVDHPALVELLVSLCGRPSTPYRLIDRTQFAELLSIGTSTFDKLRATGVIGPRPVRLGGAVRWELREVEAYLAARNPAGDLYDASTWPAIWADRQKGGRK